jgi:hypothetical protein
MDLIDLLLLITAVLFALASRKSMKRVLTRRFGRANGALLEIDYWKATPGEGLARGILAIEILSWVAIVLLVAQLAFRSIL